MPDPILSPARGLRALSLALGLACLMASVAVASGPPFGERPVGRHVLDDARVIPPDAEQVIEETLAALEASSGQDLVLYTQIKGTALTKAEALSDADALLTEWQVGGGRGNGAAMLWNLDRGTSEAVTAISMGQRLQQKVDIAAVDRAVNDAMRSAISARDWAAAATSGMLALSIATSEGARPDESPAASGAPLRTPRPRDTPEPGESPGVLPTIGPAPPAGPPYPDPIDGVTVYDHAGILRPDTIRAAADTIAEIEERTGAEIVVYSQVKPESDSPAAAEHDAIALIDQWGVGRRGFDDGLAILFDLDDSRCHGQVQLYAGPGYAAAFLTNAERQRIFEEDMLPSLRVCDFDSAILFAMERLDEAATPEHAQALQLARQVDAAAGLVLAPLALVLLLGWAGWSWLRYGRDPEYLDDPSIHLPAPPPGLSPAGATVLFEGRATRRALTTALVELAGRGEIRFRHPFPVGLTIEIDLTVPDQRDARLARNRRDELGAAEGLLLEGLREAAGPKRTLAAEDLKSFGSHVERFDDRLEATVTEKGWFREPPERAVERWSFRGTIVGVLGVLGVSGGFALPSNGLLLVGSALVVAGVAMFIIARVMPQRTLEGARLFAQLVAYRRTLQKTLEQAHTIDQVASSEVLPWVETPDQVVMWGYAFGLHEEVEEVLERSMEDVRAGTASPTRTYFPIWYTVGEAGSSRVSGGVRGAAAGLFSSSAMPDFSSMTAALSTIGASGAGSDGSGGSGGFGGGISGLGGGAGGGF